MSEIEIRCSACQYFLGQIYGDIELQNTSRLTAKCPKCKAFRGIELKLIKIKYKCLTCKQKLKSYEEKKKHMVANNGHEVLGELV